MYSRGQLILNLARNANKREIDSQLARGSAGKFLLIIPSLRSNYLYVFLENNSDGFQNQNQQLL